jgi:hypothetical protein
MDTKGRWLFSTKISDRNEHICVSLFISCIRQQSLGSAIITNIPSHWLTWMEADFWLLQLLESLLGIWAPLQIHVSHGSCSAFLSTKWEETACGLGLVVNCFCLEVKHSYLFLSEPSDHRGVANRLRFSLRRRCVEQVSCRRFHPHHQLVGLLLFLFLDLEPLSSSSGQSARMLLHMCIRRLCLWDCLAPEVTAGQDQIYWSLCFPASSPFGLSVMLDFLAHQKWLLGLEVWLASDKP